MPGWRDRFRHFSDTNAKHEAIGEKQAGIELFFRFWQIRSILFTRQCNAVKPTSDTPVSSSDLARGIVHAAVPPKPLPPLSPQ